MRLAKIWTSDGLPLDLEEVKLDLRVDSSDDDATVERMIRAAADFAEIRTGYVFAPGTYYATADDWNCAFPYCDRGRVEIPKGPLREVNAISYMSGNDAWTDVDLADFLILKRKKTFTVAPLSTFDAPDLFVCMDAIRISFDAGFDPVDGDSALSGDPLPIDAGLKTMLTMLVGHYYKNRELFEADKLGEIEQGAGSLLGAYRQFY